MIGLCVSSHFGQIFPSFFQAKFKNFDQKVVEAILRPDTTQAPQLMRMAEDELTRRPTPLVVDEASASQHDVSQERGLSAESCGN